MGSRTILFLGVGATLTGSLRVASMAYDVSPGPLLAVGVSYRLLDEKGAAPFVLLGATLGASLSGTALRGSTSGSDSMIGTDLRASIAVGKTLLRTMSPYLTARAFGLPVLWTFQGQSVTGTDAYHYQVGAGFSLKLGRFDLALEMVPLGERAIVAGGGITY